MVLSAVVLFDAECPPCRTLAVWAQARAAGSSLVFQAWQDFASTPAAADVLTSEQRALPADTLRVLTGATLLEGPAAWEHLVEQHPTFQQLSWMARNLGLSHPEGSTGRALMQAGRIVRRLCRRCRQHSAR